ncbi:ras GTPase-activating-like protein IQGAP3 [Leucoraja erinacea]|uniref:ras GTPase-activating-like protein IQGAP3 n=1 Tax=Leucoraja erinaceus TaxID=7782 RepID=UPI0024569820|nr:ras GTPase-activating-like protein IQGAP3 [Leucoraja erinacea]
MANEVESSGRRPCGYGLGSERLTAEEMDERRRQNIAYEYLCHLEEAKRWMEVCLDEELPPTTDLEESLRNGVFLAKLGHRFAPTVVPQRKIYDQEQLRYKATGLHFRHTDNINHWLNAMAKIALPSIFYPETTDIYDKKNIPRVVYCVHAFSLYLFKLGLAPQIQDLYGKVNFTEEEINNMKTELDKYGIQMPSFSKIGGILANELSVDEAAVHAAVIAINEAIDRGLVEQTLVALRNPNAMLVNLADSLAPVYQEILCQAKSEKSANARKRFDTYKAELTEGKDMYEELLTHAEIQGNINKVNVQAALEYVDEALEKSDVQALYSALQSPVLNLHQVNRENMEWYMDQLLIDREQKALELGMVDPLEKEELQAAVHAANENASVHLSMMQSVARINAAVRKGIPAGTTKELMDPSAKLPEVYPFAGALYQRELAALQRQKPQGELTQEELYVAVEMLSAVALINRALEAGDVGAFWSSLLSPATGLTDVKDESVQRYFDALRGLKQQSGRNGETMLSWNSLQLCVRDVNSAMQEEHQQIAAIVLINEALDGGDPERTIAALLMPSAGLVALDFPAAIRYHHVLAAAKRHKAKATRDQAAMLWLEEIQEGIHKANQDSQMARKMSLGVAAINQAIKEAKVSQTLRVLRSPEVALCGVVLDCARAYQTELAVLVRVKVDMGDNRSPWVKHVLKDGSTYYFNLQRLEGSWERPQGFVQSSTQLDRAEIQSTVAAVTAVYNRERLWQANEGMIVGLQAHMKGYLVRNDLSARKHFIRRQLPAIIKIQSHWRGCRQRRDYQRRLNHLHANTADIIKIQSWVRMWQVRRRYKARLQYFKRNIASVVKIQAFVRANKARGDYKMLVHAQNPPLNVVRKFAHLLDQSDYDFREEWELMQLREEVVQRIRSSRQLEQDLNVMDIKIGLLVKNRITLQEVVSHCKKLTRKNKEQLSDLMVIDKQKGLKALSREKREKLEAYQHLFYLLQTKPVYLAKLIFQMPQNRSTKFMESVIFSLYNYASNEREGYLLLGLFTTALREEIRSKVDRVREIVTGNPMVTRLVVSFYRNVRGQNALRDILGPVVKEVLQDKTLSIKTDPVDIYKCWVNQMESQSGQRSQLPYEVTIDQALTHPEVERRLDISIRNLRAATDKFLNAIISSVDKIPYGMRYTAKVLKSSLRERFPGAPEEELLKVVGNLLYYRYMNPAVVAPDGFDIIDVTVGGGLHADHRRNLGSIAKLLQLAASGKTLEGENAQLRTMADYLLQSQQRFRAFFRAACDVPEPEERFNVDEYSEMVSLNKPIIYITAGELINTHKLLLQHQDSLSVEHSDPLHQLLEDLGDVPTVESLLGEGSVTVTDAQEDHLAQLYKMEVSLTLSNKFDLCKSGNATSDTRGLLLSTKQLIVDVIRSQSGDSLTEILQTSASTDQVADHQRMVHKRAIRDARTPDKMKGNRSLLLDNKLPIDEKKRRIVRSLRKLEAAGVVSTANHHQELINEIARDIQNHRRYRQQRKTELSKLKQTLRGISSKTAFFEEQIDYYNQYIKTCLDNLTAKAMGPGKKPAEAKGRKNKALSLNYTAARLQEKGVLLAIEDLPTSQFRNVIFDIVQSEQVGTFEVRARFMGVDMEKFQLKYQDLLQLQYEGVAVMKMFDKAKVNVNLLIFLLNKKFFKK